MWIYKWRNNHNPPVLVTQISMNCGLPYWFCMTQSMLKKKHRHTSHIVWLIHTSYISWEKKPQAFCIPYQYCKIHADTGHAIAQVVSHRLHTVAAQVRARVRSCGVCGRQSGIVVGSLQVLLFPLPIVIPPTAPQSSSITWGWYSRPKSGQCTKWTHSHPTKGTKNLTDYMQTHSCMVSGYSCEGLSTEKYKTENTSLYTRIKSYCKTHPLTYQRLSCH
jgi:hypothetical protein